MEQLARARQEWNQKEIEQRRKQLELRQERSDANEDFKEINKSLKDYKKVNDLEIIYNGKKFTHEPHIWDFYNPSDEMKEYMTLAIGTMGLVGGWTGGLSLNYYKRSKQNIYHDVIYILPFDFVCFLAYDVLNGLSGRRSLSLSAFTPMVLSPNATASLAAPLSVIGTPSVSFVSFLLANDIPTAPAVSTAAS